MKAKIIESGFYSGENRKFVALDKERDVLTFSHVCKFVSANNEKLCFTVKRGSPWLDKERIKVYLRFEDYNAIA